ncbi:MAG: helix-turn-helix domain-containing protein [Desulfatibacillaceae bacterium]
MSKPTDVQVIVHDGKPAFAVIPWDAYQELLRNQPEDEADVWFPHEVVRANVRGDRLPKAWREYLGLTQEELARRSGLKQPAIVRLEKPGARPRRTTLEKLARAMGITTEQLVD